jgi:hypothetical protein
VTIIVDPQLERRMVERRMIVSIDFIGIVLDSGTEKISIHREDII